MIVVDVNVLAYLFIDSKRTSEAEALLREDPDWAAPLLWRSEWRNVLAGYVRRGSLDRGAALECIEAAERIVRHREYLVDGAQVMDLVANSSCSAYDCEYVALADTFHVPLVTYDRRVLDDFPVRAVNPASYLERSP